MADFFLWDPQQLSVNVAAMDEEHQVLIQKMNALYSEFKSEAGAEKIAPLLADLVSYAQKHFSDEEAYMASINYPGLEEHKKKHKQLLDQVQQNVELFQSSGELSPSFFQLLSLWLKSHIQGSDQQYSKSKAKAA